MPKVSICIPNLNTRPYLPERFETIFNQTSQDWELVVCDSYSDDGSWEYIQELAAREPRMRISQTLRKGVYAGFNDCIQLARGEHVYIVTSDDTMLPDFLEKMVADLDKNPGCAVAHYCLDFIDEHGVKICRGDCCSANSWLLDPGGRGSSACTNGTLPGHARFGSANFHSL